MAIKVLYNSKKKILDCEYKYEFTDKDYKDLKGGGD